MTLKIHNTATRKKEVFQSLEENKVKMYVCGPTVYNYVHIGNARPVVVFDTLFRVLQTLYDEVIYARNITDIDDKIMNAAKESGRCIESISREYADAYEIDMKQLNTLTPTIVPYATDHVGQMIAMVEKLVDKGHAYEADGHVLFSVQSMKTYGQLSNRALEDMLDGARVDVASYKKYAGDFVLWKPSSDDEPGWSSPWGRGRPGWHLECSAMIEEHLGETIDIHGGGRDLIFPHHENERAQSECAHGGKAYVKYWMHNGYLNINGEKMSKSLGNFKTVRDLLQQYPGEVIRYALLSAHYRSELDFSADLLDQSKASLDSLYGALRNTVHSDIVNVTLDVSVPGYAALLDDLNTSLAISDLHRLAKELNKSEANESLKTDALKIKSELIALGGLMGLLQTDPQVWFQGDRNEDSTDIDALVEERVQAKSNKNYARADEIRSTLHDLGIELEDTREGTIWRRV